MQLTTSQRKRTTLFALAALLTLPAVAQKKVQLVVDLPKNASYVMSNSVAQDISQTIMGMEQGMSQNMEFVVQFDVVEKRRNGNFSIDMTYNEVRFDSKNPMGTASYDSADPDSEPTQETLAYSAMVGQTIGMDMTPNASIEDVRGLDALIDNMLNAYGIPEGAQRAEVKGMLDQQFNSSSLKNQIGAAMVAYPNNAVGVGDSWKDTREVSAGFPLVINATYTVKEIRDDVVILDVKSDIETGKMDKPMQMQGMEMMYKLSGTQNGTMTVDRKTGWVLSASIDQDVSGNVDLLPNAQVPDGMSWPISIKSTNSTTIIE